MEGGYGTKRAPPPNPPSAPRAASAASASASSTSNTTTARGGGGGLTAKAIAAAGAEAPGAGADVSGQYERYNLQVGVWTGGRCERAVRAGSKSIRASSISLLKRWGAEVNVPKRRRCQVEGSARWGAIMPGARAESQPRAEISVRWMAGVRARWVLVIGGE
eukprot:1152962-Pelagomonas_calceolata.AAC.9